uniref:DUF5597 domain-containing protein n=1 Tax=Panagrellus redivivus TaxID=6233 RepID=A0A7E4W7Z6_PANRE
MPTTRTRRATLGMSVGCTYRLKGLTPEGPGLETENFEGSLDLRRRLCDIGLPGNVKLRPTCGILVFVGKRDRA